MTHLWVRAEQRQNEKRCGVTPDGVAALIKAGVQVTVEESTSRVFSNDAYAATGAEMATEGSWPNAPDDAIIFGLKELPEDGSPLKHTHIMFGHAFKGQFSGRALLDRFKAGGGTLYDLEYLVDETGRRVAAFGYWAGFAGAAVALRTWQAQKRGETCAAVGTYPNKDALLDELRASGADLANTPNSIVIGALGRVGAGAADLLETMGGAVTKWDMAETANGGPFPKILDHEIFINAILARPGTPVFVPKTALSADRRLTVIGDVACDPDSDYNPVPVYDKATTWDAPACRVSTAPILDVMAIDNLPSLLPLESSLDFAEQLLPTLMLVTDLTEGVWTRAKADFERNL